MKFSKIMLISCLCVMGLTGCTLDKSAIIKVNDDVITKSQYEDVYKKETDSPQYKQFDSFLKDEDSLMSLMIRDRLVNELILKSLINQEVKKREITVSKEEVDKRKAEIAEQLGSEEKVNELLKKNGISNKKYTEDIENELKIDKLTVISGDIKVTDKEVKDFYNQNKASFNYPERVRASHILIEVNPAQIKQEIISKDKKGKLTSEEINKQTQEIVDKKMELAKEVRAKAAANPSEFANLAKQYSDDKVSALRGGDLGFFPREAMVKPFADAAFSLKPGTVSEIVVSDYGNHIIIVTDKAKAGLQPYDQMKEEISAYLEQTKKVESLKKLIDGLKATAKIEFTDPAFDLNNIQNKIREKSKQPPVEQQAAK